MNPKLVILSQGEEIITGDVADTNAAWLSQQATKMGFEVACHTAVGDKLDDLVQALREIANRADCCLCTGGLGPTVDDLTAEAVSKAFDLPLVFDETAFDQIRQFFVARNRQFPDCNRKQALLPKGSVRLDNHVGTAPGFALQQRRCWFAFMPGVPSEMRHLFETHIEQMLRAKYELKPKRLIAIKTIGIGESSLQELINQVTIPPNVQLGFRADLGEVQTKLLFPYGYPEAQIQTLIEELTTQLGDKIFTVEGLDGNSGKLVAIVDGLMMAKGQSLAIVENACRGLLAVKIAAFPWLQASVYQQNTEQLAKQFDVAYPDDLGIFAKSIAEAVSTEYVSSMVLVQLAKRQGDLQPNQYNRLRVQSALLTETGFHEAEHILFGDDQRQCQQAAVYGLDLLRRYLQGKPPK